MSTTLISVRGSREVELEPERGTVHLQTHYRGLDREVVRDRVTHAAATINERIAEQFDAEHGPITFRSADQMHIWSHRSYNDEGEELPFVHTADIALRAEFSDFAELSRFVNWAGQIQDVEVLYTGWSLTTETTKRVQREVQGHAVREARDRAQNYADALGLGAVRAEAVADVGLLGVGESRNGYDDGNVPLMATGGPAGRGSVAEVELTPRKIVVSATVEGSFSVGLRQQCS